MYDYFNQDFRNAYIRYRAMLLKMEQLVTIRSCIACPRDNEVGNSFVSLDGNFRLVRRAKAGKYNVRSAGNFFFVDDTETRAAASRPDDGYSLTCDHRFTAAENAIKSPINDVKGLFGASCPRHDMPLQFSNMFHGERYFNLTRYAYPKLILNKLNITPQNERDQKSLGTTFIFYDIACKFQSSFGDNGFKYCIPKMHVYAHNTQCFRRYHPLRTEGLGVVDGEGCERIWSMLSNFAYMTRGMLPSNRMDQLEDKILHFFRSKRQNILEVLGKSKIKYQKELVKAEQFFAELNVSVQESRDLFIKEKEGTLNLCSKKN